MTKKKSSKNSKNNGEDTVVHIKFNRPEAIQSKRDLLFAQRSILELLKHIKRYHLLRKKELVLKEKANKKIKETNKEINHLKRTLPKPKLPDILKEEGKEEKKEDKKEGTPKIDQELEEIQKKLAQLEQTTQNY